MHTVFVILSLVVALVALASAAMDFRGTPQIEDLMRRLGYRPKFEHMLGVIKVAGALGLLVGLGFGYTVLALAAAFGFTLYFVLAVRAHRRIGDPAKESAPAIGLTVLSAAALLTGVLS